MTDIRLKRARVVRRTESDVERDETVPEVVSGTIGAREAPKPILAEGSSSLATDRLAPILTDETIEDSTRVPTRRLPRIQFTPPPPIPRMDLRPAPSATRPPPQPVAVTVVRPLVARREPTPQPIPPAFRLPIRWDIVLVTATIMTLVMAAVVALVR